MTASNLLAALAIAVGVGTAAIAADTPILTLRATVAGPQAAVETLRIELLRWSTDAERAPLLKAAEALYRPPAPPAAPAAPAAGRAGRAGGRGGRGGRGAEPPNPVAQFTGTVKAAPTVGFVWGEGVTGYSIKYAWRAPQPDGGERIVLVTDRRLGAHAPSWPAASSEATAADAEFTVIEMRIDATGAGEGKTSLATRIVVDAAAETLALDGYAAAPPLLKVVR